VISRYVFQRNRSPTGTAFLTGHLAGAVNYDRIAGYFDSSLFEMAGEALEDLSGKIRILCNSDINPADVAMAEQAQKLSFFKHDPEQLAHRSGDRIARLIRMLASKKLEVRVLPDAVFGLVHGKAGVISYGDGRRTSFMGSANETYSGWNLNYELVWEDDSPEACDWVQSEFNRLWEHSLARPLADAVIKEVQRLSDRTEIDINAWKKASVESEAASTAVESPVYRKEFGLWPHQKHFIQEAWAAHKAYGARFVLADQVGLGKTVQLGMAAQLMSLYDDKPVLALLPKTLMQQWQTELWDLLEIPSARWDGRQWIDEQGLEYPPTSRNPLMDCPRRIGMVSQGLVVKGSAPIQALLEVDWSCIIVDEAHRARRAKLPKEAERGPRINNPETETNRLYAFLYKLAPKTRSLLMGTATPVQLHPIEAWDLLRLLSEGNDHVLGYPGSSWRHPENSLPFILGEEAPPDDPASLWSWLRNPFPSEREAPIFARLRKTLGMESGQAVAPYSWTDLSATQQVSGKLAALTLFDRHHPFLRCIVRRTREYLEKAINPQTGRPYLLPIQVILHGETEPVLLDGYSRQAYEAAEEFCKMLAKRVKSAGFFKTLLLRRIGSSLHAGRSTVNRMLDDWDSIDESEEDESSDDDEQESSSSTGNENTGLKNLTPMERHKLEECARALETGLKAGPESDPKWARIEEYLVQKNWAVEGCILFSQYLDTARWVAERIKDSFQDQPVGLYAGSGKSGIYARGNFLRKDREEIKLMVKTGELKLMVGTDAASEGLNLQMLGTLINVDLPWNPTRLEQRKGRIQRIGQSRSAINILNLRYAPSVEDKVHEALSTRLEEIRKMFGQIPDVLSDVWVKVALGEIDQAKQRLGEVKAPHAFDERYSRVEEVSGWDECTQVLNRAEKIEALRRGWKD
jgi:superfamily II DNA or RNA helicase